MSEPASGFGNLLQQARELESRFTRMREELAHREIHADAGGGMVRATANGAGQILRIEIDPQALQDVAVLQDLVRAAVNEALSRVQALVQSEVERAAGPLGGLLGGWLRR
jgi:DNA-binding YbaB/EbfC family protein